MEQDGGDADMNSGELLVSLNRTMAVLAKLKLACVASKHKRTGKLVEIAGTALGQAYRELEMELQWQKPAYRGERKT